MKNILLALVTLINMSCNDLPDYTKTSKIVQYSCSGEIVQEWSTDWYVRGDSRVTFYQGEQKIHLYGDFIIYD